MPAKTQPTATAMASRLQLSALTARTTPMAVARAIVVAFCLVVLLVVLVGVLSMTRT